MVLEEDGFLGALASNAGDEFHVLWAAREMLRLLDVDTEVTSVKVEGLPPDDVHAQLGEHGQAADITLTLRTDQGTAYRYLQLKHSASNPQSGWSWSRLLARRSVKKRTSSVLGKLASLMKAVEFQGDFSIVTNQPLSESVAADIARLIADKAGQQAENTELIGTLTKELGLSKRQLHSFLKAWDLKGFSASSRLIIESELLQSLSMLYDADARDDATILQERVATLMLPETQRDPPVTREIVATWLGVGDERLLYPAPSEIRPADPYLQRDLMEALGAKLKAGQTLPLRLHAAGGCGKTSLLCDLPSVLPDASEVLIYDCYGGGYFLTSDQKRHLPEQAFIQMGNELAARFRTPLLVRRQGSIDAFSAFRNRVAIAADILAKRDPDALLILCFDAVDNARKGAKHWQEPCFLDLLARASKWPANARIVVSCRTARLDEVGEAALYDDYEVPAFDVAEVGKLVALWQPTWPADLASTFHELTGGTPRRIVYALDGLSSDGAAQAIDRLMPKAKGIDPLFERRVAEAGKHLGDAQTVWRVLDSLARLPRPVPDHILATLAGITPADIRDIAVDVGGIVERADGWSFHDEDFEAFVVDRPGSDGPQILADAADLLLEIRLTDRYAANGIAEVLALAGRSETLYALVTNEEPRSKILSPLEHHFLWSRRLGFAIRCCRQASDIAAACNLLIASADAIGRARLLEKLTTDNIDLSLRFAPGEANRLVMAGGHRRRLRPRLRIELAREAAATQPETAKIHFRWWAAHLSELRQSEQRDRFEVHASDIATEYEAYAELYGDERALDRLFAWQPKPVLLDVFRLLAANAAGRKPDVLRGAVLRRRWPPAALAAIMAAALFAGVEFATPEMREGLKRLARITRARWPKAVKEGLAHASPLSWQEAVLFVAERAHGDAELRPLIVQLLDRVFPRPELNEAHHLFRLRSAGARYARAHALRERVTGIAVPVTDWLPPMRAVPPPPPNDKPWKRRDEPPELRWNDALKETAVVYGRLVQAARATLDGVANGDLIAAWPGVADALRLTHSYAERSRRDPDQELLLMRNHLMHAATGGSNVADLVPRLRKILQGWSADSIQRSQDLARALALVPASHDAAHGLLTGLAEQIESEALPARERVTLLSACARTALPLDENLAEWFFGKAVDATGAVDFEARAALAATAAIAAAGLGGSHEETSALAVRLANGTGAVVTSLGIGHDFEWDKAASWVAAANLPTGLAAAARWHDRGIASYPRTLPAIIETASGLTLAQRAALATLAADDDVDLDLAIGASDALPRWFVEPAIASLRNRGEIDALLDGSELIARRAAADAAPAIDALQPELDRLAGWVGRVPADRDIDEDDESEDARPEPIGDAAAIRAALAPSDNDRGPYAFTYMHAARRLTGRALRIPFLDIAIDIAGTEGDFGEAIPHILADWSDYPPAADWARRRLPTYIVGALSGLFAWRYDDSETLEAALAATGLGASEQADILLEGIERQGEGISAELLFTLTGMIAGRANEKERVPLFDALLKRVETRATHPAEVQLTGPPPRAELAECIALTLFVAMGDMDRRVGWRAAHAGLILMRGDDPAWDRLAKCIADESAGIFQGEPFYRYAALEQLLATLERAAAERPEAVAPHASLILDTIQREPHLIVRELGRSILLALDASGASRLNAGDRALVEKLNRNALPLIEHQQSIARRSRRSDDQPKRRYSFDDTDAIPYWYSPVLDMFSLPLNDFLDRLEHWLCDKWGYVATTTHWVKEPRRTRLENMHQWTSRRHGARPAVERLSYHIEWHAMMCAVGELIVDHPLVEPRDDDEDRFLDWMRDMLPTLAPLWLSDLRTPPPLEPRFWGLRPEPAVVVNAAEEDEEDESYESLARTWGKSIKQEDFSTEIEPDGRIVIAADYELRWDQAIQRVDIQSALVSPATAMALARALATARDRMDYALPDARYHEDIAAPGFELEAWLSTLERDALGDKYDMVRGSISGIPVQPVGVTRSELLHFDRRRSAWRTPEGTDAIAIAQWGSEEAPNGRGWRAAADRNFLSGLLAKTGRSLIINIEISRQFRNSDIDDNPTRWSLYVLDALSRITFAEKSRRDLGRYLVRREGLDRSVDTLGRWMLHRAAELDALRGQAAPGARVAIDAEIEATCEAFRRRERRRF